VGVDLAHLDKVARTARDAIAAEKHRLLANAWRACQAQAEDAILLRLEKAEAELLTVTRQAAEQGKTRHLLLRLPYGHKDLRHVLQEYLHAQSPEYPKLKSLGPPSFKDIEGWLERDLKVKDWAKKCPLDWLLALDTWRTKKGITRLLAPAPPGPPQLQSLWKACLTAKLKTTFEFFEHREEEGLAWWVNWAK
jgi:hypothetical protein